jgi:hypothetical protein
MCRASVFLLNLPSRALLNIKDLYPCPSMDEESYNLKKGMKKCEIHWEAGQKFRFKASRNQNFTNGNEMIIYIGPPILCSFCGLELYNL